MESHINGHLNFLLCGSQKRKLLHQSAVKFQNAYFLFLRWLQIGHIVETTCEWQWFRLNFGR